MASRTTHTQPIILRVSQQAWGLMFWMMMHVFSRHLKLITLRSNCLLLKALFYCVLGCWVCNRSASTSCRTRWPARLLETELGYVASQVDGDENDAQLGPWSSLQSDSGSVLYECMWTAFHGSHCALLDGYRVVHLAHGRGHHLALSSSRLHHGHGYASAVRSSTD